MSAPLASFPWNDAHVAALRKCVADGLSSGQTAIRFYLLFRIVISRNAVIGKAARLKLRLLGQSGTNMKASRKSRKPPPAARAFHVPAEPLPPTDAPRAIPPAPNSRPVDLMGLTNWTCRFPLWGDGPGEPRLFCGALEADNANGMVYCPFHARAATNHGRGRDDTVEGVAR